MRVDPKLEREQVERLRAVRATRAPGPHADALSRLETAAKGADNLVPIILDAVKADATVGEISNVLRGVWGEHIETLVL
jgi:methylmalonyl-CoA mutase N-terminal domain/subunit